MRSISHAFSHFILRKNVRGQTRAKPTELPRPEKIPSLNAMLQHPRGLDILALRSAERLYLRLAIARLLDLRKQALLMCRPLTNVLEDDVQRLRVVAKRDIQRVLCANRDRETIVRSWAWALNHPRRCHELRLWNYDRNELFNCHKGENREVAGQGCSLWWWVDSEPLPDGLIHLANRENATLLASESAAGRNRSRHVWISANNAMITAFSSATTEHHLLALNATAAAVQAILAAPHPPGWIRMTPPEGFKALEHDTRIDQVAALIDEQRIPLLWQSGPGSGIVLPREILQKLASYDRYKVGESGKIIERKDTAMNRNGTGMNDIIWPDSNGAITEGPTKPNVAIVTGSMPEDGPRDLEELRKLVDTPIDSARDLCRLTNMRLRGTVEDLDGNEVPVDVRIEDESTFTADGLTRAIPELFARYVHTRTYDEMRPRLERNPELFDDEEVSFLESMLTFMTTADEEDS